MKSLYFWSFLFATLSVKADIITVTSVGLTFNPSNIIITEGDTLRFNISGSHNVVEVDSATYATNGSTSLANGFSLPFGGGDLTGLSAGRYWFVCTPHASAGMKGSITVSKASSTNQVVAISNAGLTFVPDSVVVNAGDTLRFTLNSSHNALEVDSATWASNGTSALTGGFSLPFGGGDITNIPVGKHWYVCTPHASQSMKGIIIVRDTTLHVFDPIEVELFTARAQYSNSVIALFTTSPEPFQLQYKLYSLEGKVMASSNNFVVPKGDGHQVIEPISLTPGTYILLFYLEDRLASKSRFIVQE